jgi:hypothetical protein
MTSPRLAHLFLVGILATGCAVKTPPTTGPEATPNDLEAARAAVKEAQAAHAKERAPEAYRRALEYLRQAETGSGSAAREAAIRAEGSARLAAAQARCETAASAPGRAPANGADLERARAELKQALEEHRRLEERVALQQQALELTETELIRSKARLKGIETKAEASSAIAEAHILMRRLGARSAAAALCQESLAKAEQQLAVENYGAATFFALKAQDIANRARAAQPRP